MDIKKIFSVALLVIFQIFFAKVYNVQDYGATPNDTKDDTKAIQDCIDEAAKNGGGTVFFPNGNYIVSRTSIRGKAWCLNSKSNITFKGESRQNSIITLQKSQPNYTRMLYIENVANVSINQLTFDGNWQNQVNPSNPNEHLGAVFIDQSNNVGITDCNFINTGGDGVGIRGVKSPSKNVSITNCKFANNQRNGITLGSGFDGVEIKNCIFENTIDDSPVDTEPSGGICQNVLIENNKIYTPTLLTLGGASYQNTGKNFQVRNNQFFNCKVMMVNAENVFFENNEFNIDTKKGIIFKLVNYNKNINISKNKIQSKNQEVLYVVASRYAKKQPEYINFYNNKITLSGSKLRAFHLRGSNHVCVKSNTISINEGKDNSPLLIASNYPVQQIEFSDNIFVYFDQPISIQSIKRNEINGVKIENNTFQFKNKSTSQLVEISKGSEDFIKNKTFNSNKINGVKD